MTYSRESDFRHESDDHRFFLALAAVAISILVHVVMVYWFGGHTMTPATLSRQQRDRRVHRLETALHVEPLPPRIAPDREPLSVPADADVGDHATGPLDRVADLAHRPDVDQTTPPALTREIFRDHPVPERPLFSEAPSEYREWVPRPIIQEITELRVPTEEALLPRREIPLVERSPAAAGEIPPFDVWPTTAVTGSDHGGGVDAAAALPASSKVQAPAPTMREPVLDADRIEPMVTMVPPQDIPAESVAQVTPYEPMERLLKVGAHVYRRSPGRGPHYIQIVIDRADAAVLPVIPKDVVLIQDVSASLAEERLRLCRLGWLRALPLLSAEDRFNVMAFRDQTETAFPDWAPVRSDTLATAASFVETFRSAGATDLYASMDRLLEKTRLPGRPAIALVITDGHPNTGLTQSAEIIAAFTRRNRGAISVYTLGTQRSANAYLLDMLAYSNRGTGAIVNGGRWGIPDLIVETVRGFSRPALTDIRVRFDAASNVEVAPELSSNLYADRPLILYARCPPDTRHVVFQVRGAALDRRCDMVFELDLQQLPSVNDESIRRIWAQQYLNTLLAQYTLEKSPTLLQRMHRLSREYRVPVPYPEGF